MNFLPFFKKDGWEKIHLDYFAKVARTPSISEKGRPWEQIRTALNPQVSQHVFGKLEGALEEEYE